jgi:putative ABC transport system permease protein
MRTRTRRAADLLHYPLSWLTDAPLADAMLGDLEEIRHRLRRQSAPRATLWFWGAAVSLMLHAVGVRLREALTGWRRSVFGSRGAGGDVGHALRTLRRNPAFGLSAILLLALGIGANTVVFSVVHAVVLRPLPYVEPERLVYLWGDTGTNPGNRHSILTGSHVAEIARHNTFLESYAVTMPWDTTVQGLVDMVRDDGSDRLRGAFVTPNLFELLGVQAALGRTFQSTDDEAMPVALISGDLWKRRFGRAPGVLGMQVRLAPGSTSRSQPPYTIVGVLPDDVRFTYPRDTEIYLLLPWSQIRRSRALAYTMIGRLRGGVTPGQAEAELTTLNRNVVSRYENISRESMPALLARTQGMVEPVQTHVAAEVRPGLMLLSAVAGLVLLIACVNLGLLMLARTVDRTRELAVRAALGAGPRRIVRLLAIEGLVLAGIGGGAGVALAAAVMPLVTRLLPAVVPRTEQVALDTTVLAFAAAVTGLTALVCGMTPGILATRRDLLAVLRRSGITSTATRAAGAWRSAVVALQVAVVLMLLVGAGLLLHSFWKLQNVNLGFEAADLLTLETRLYNPKYRTQPQVAAFERELLEHVRRLPGVEQATITTAVPMRGTDFRYVIGPVGGRPQPGHMRSVGAEYFDMMRIPLRAGRLFTDADAATAAPVMVVSESYGRQHFGSANPVGRMMALHDTPVEIVGVVGDVRYAQVARDAAPAFYVPRAQSPVRLICLLVKPRPGMQASVAESLRGAVGALDPEQPVEGLTTVAEIVSQSTADRRFYALATGAFAAVALLLAIAGLFSVVSRAVTERRRELAIRAAVGADRTCLLRLVLTAGLLPVVAGAAAGLAAAGGGSRVLRGFLFEVPPTDTVSYAGAAGLVLCVSLAACLRPAVRAARMDPMAALKNE